jgi:hypothetical protein
MAGQGMDEELRSEIFKNAKQLHGVPYLSRYGYVEETLEMELYLHAIVAEKLESNVLSLCYACNASFCDIETVEDFMVNDPDGVRLSQAAADHLSLFHLFGAAGHSVSFH